jgi:hypothetical protein
MSKLSIYFIAFSCVGLTANLHADQNQDEEKRVEEAIQEQKRVDQTIENKKAESYLEERRREDQEIERRREEERRRDQSENEQYSDNYIADQKDDDDRLRKEQQMQMQMQKQLKEEKQIQQQPIERKQQIQQRLEEKKQQFQEQPIERKQQIQERLQEKKQQFQQQPVEKQVQFQQRLEEKKQQFQQQPVEKQVQFQQQHMEKKQQIQQQLDEKKQQFHQQPTERKQQIQQKLEEKKQQFQQQPVDQKQMQFQKQPKDGNKVAQPISKDQFRKKADQWNQKGKKDRAAFKDYHKKKHVFDKDYWNKYHNKHHHWHFKDNFNWWVNVSYPGLTNWLNYSTIHPWYYYYGDDGYIYYSDSPYGNYILVQNYNDFYNQTIYLARHIPQVDPQSVRWMALGVYALAPIYGPDVSPNDYFTLAASPDGLIGGVYFNPDKNQNEEIIGIIDSKSLRAVWKFIGSDWPIFEAGLLNFTEEQSTAIVHYPDGNREAQLMIKLEE